jgi:hypothetical protein
MSNTELAKNSRRTQVLGKGEQFMFLIRHCHSKIREIDVS